MTFNTTLETTLNIAKITLVGELDRQSAPLFQEQVEKAASTQEVEKLVLLMKDLEYMSSAGLRVLIIAKQKMGTAESIYIVGAPETILETLEKTGFDQSVFILDEYDPSVIEKGL